MPHSGYIIRIRGVRTVTLPFQMLTLYTLEASGNQHPVSGNDLTAQNDEGDQFPKLVIVRKGIEESYVNPIEIMELSFVRLIVIRAKFTKSKHPAREATLSNIPSNKKKPERREDLP